MKHSATRDFYAHWDEQRGEAKAPDRAGQFYVDTKNNAVYHSVGNGAVSDWKNA